MGLFSAPGGWADLPGGFFAREAENIRQGATEAGRLARALAVCSFAGACAVAPRRSPPSLQVMSRGGAMVYPGLSPPASAPGVLRWGRHPPNLPFPPTVRHSPWSRASPWLPQLLTEERGTPFSSENSVFSFAGSGVLAVSLWIYAAADRGIAATPPWVPLLPLPLWTAVSASALLCQLFLIPLPSPVAELGSPEEGDEDNAAVQKEEARMVLVSHVCWAPSVLKMVRRSFRPAISSENTTSPPADVPN